MAIVGFCLCITLLLCCVCGTELTYDFDSLQVGDFRFLSLQLTASFTGEVSVKAPSCGVFPDEPGTYVMREVFDPSSDSFWRV